MEIKYFRLIKTIAEEGNMANSSRRLFLTQSALSHQLRELEERLEFKVFLRKRNSWELTKEGNELHKLAVKVLDTMDEGFQKINSIKNGTKGVIRIGTECPYFYQHMLALIKRMGLFYPEINVDIILDPLNDPLKKLLNNELDIALLHYKPNENTLFNQELFEDEIFVFSHKEHFFNNMDFVEAKEFSKVHLLIHSYPIESVYIYDKFLKPNNVEPKQITAIPMTEVALEMVNSNMGVICKPKWAFEYFKEFGNIIPKQIGVDGLKRTHVLTIRKEDKVKKYVNDFTLNFKNSFDIIN